MDVISGRALTVETFAAACRPSEEGRVHVDLARAEFVDAYAIVGVACALAAARHADRPAHLTLPDSEDAQKYLSRMHLERTLRGSGVTATGHLPPVREHDQTGNLLELRRFDDFGSCEELGNLLHGRLEGNADPQVVEALYEATVELGFNAAEHARSPGGGFMCAQTYRRGSPDEYLVLGVGDVGIGIPGSLRRSHGDLTDEDAVGMAMTRDVSSTGEPGRGQGLAEVADYGQRLGGTVTVHSGTARADVGRNQWSLRSVSALPGTLVGARVPCRPGT